MNPKPSQPNSRREMLKSTVASVAGLSALTATDAAAMPAAPTSDLDTKHA